MIKKLFLAIAFLGGGLFRAQKGQALLRPFTVELVDLFGKRIKTVLPKQNQQAGEYTLHIPVSDFSTGTYFLTISSTNQTKTEKIIINK